MSETTGFNEHQIDPPPGIVPPPPPTLPGATTEISQDVASHDIEEVSGRPPHDEESAEIVKTQSEMPPPPAYGASMAPQNPDPPISAVAPPAPPPAPDPYPKYMPNDMAVMDAVTPDPVVTPDEPSAGEKPADVAPPVVATTQADPDATPGVHDLRAPPHPATVGEQTAVSLLRNLWTLFSGFAREYPYDVPDGAAGEAVKLAQKP